MDALKDVALAKYAEFIGIKEYECKDEYIQQALQQLDMLERTCLLLQIDEEFSIEDIADIIEKSEKDVENLLQKARVHIYQLYWLLLEEGKEGKEDITPSPILLIDALGVGGDCLRWQNALASFSPEIVIRRKQELLNDHAEHCLACQRYLKQYEQINDLVHGMPTIKPTTFPTQQIVQFLEEQNNIERTNKNCTRQSFALQTPLNCTVFVSYAHEDKKYATALVQHLSVLQWQGIISCWYDYDISAGTQWKEEIAKRANRNAIVLPLISPNFIMLNACDSSEIRQTLEKDTGKGFQIIPIIVRQVDWESVSSHPLPLKKLQPLPTNGKPIQKWRSIDEALLNVMRGIEKVVGKLVSIQQNTRSPYQESLSDMISQKMVKQDINTITVTDVLEEKPTHTLSSFKENDWIRLRSPLYEIARRLVLSSKISSWHGQEDELAEDVVQETLLRCIENYSSMQLNHVLLHSSIFYSISNIAYHYVKELEQQETHRRNDGRYQKQDGFCDAPLSVLRGQEELFLLIAQEVKTFPEGQKRAMLTDLANSMVFIGTLTPLRKAFLTVGIDLENYQKPLPLDNVERAKYTALLSISYKHLRELKLNDLALENQHQVPQKEENDNEEIKPLPFPSIHNKRTTAV